MKDIFVEVVPSGTKHMFSQTFDELTSQHAHESGVMSLVEIHRAVRAVVCDKVGASKGSVATERKALPKGQSLAEGEATGKKGRDAEDRGDLDTDVKKRREQGGQGRPRRVWEGGNAEKLRKAGTERQRNRDQKLGSRE